MTNSFDLSTIISRRFLQEMDSPEKAEDYILTLLQTGNDPYLISDPRESAGSALDLISEKMRFAAQQQFEDPAQREIVLQFFSHWDQATLNIITDPEKFARKTCDGNLGTISEYVGLMVSFAIPLAQSPHAKDGRHIAPVRKAIAYNDIATGRITRDHEEIQGKQGLLLSTLCSLEEAAGQIDMRYWNGIARNLDYIDIAHRAAVAVDDPHAEAWLCQGVGHFWDSGREPLYTGSGRMIYHHFDGKNPFDRFLQEHDAEMIELFGARTNIYSAFNRSIAIPQHFSVVNNGFVILTDYQGNEKSGIATYAYVTPEKYEEGSLLYGARREEPRTAIEQEVLAQVNGMELFKKTYAARVEELRVEKAKVVESAQH
ncbi:hypothetical protein HZB02_05750 [Candidatus Woesearchaeota archaeon]|nr:hypothetical protein [Candidatus Woesearchaeota archaeon]